MRSPTKLGALCSLLSLVSCGDPIKEAQRVEELRVLGAQVSVDDDEARATVMPGEAAHVEWLLADPTGLAPLAVWSMQVCVAEETSYGVPFCRDAPFMTAEVSELSNLPPLLDFTVPDSAALASATRLAVLALFCDGGQPNLSDDFESSTCDGATTVQRASFDIFLDNGDAPNHNPDLTGSRLSLGSAPWDDSPGTPDCNDPNLLTLPAGSGEHLIELVLPESAREPQVREFDEIDLESLQISHVASLGRLDRPFSSIAPEDTSFTIQLPWEAPESLPQPMLASFYFVVRDGRGGASWLSRSLCVEP